MLLLVQQPRAVAADSAASLQDRARALQAIGRSCTKDDLPLLTRLGQPYIGPWVIWHGALEAMSHCRLEQTAPYWRDLITFPRLPVRQIALIGLLRTGAPGDLELIGDAMHREDDPVMRRWAAQAPAILRLPVARRDSLLPR